MPDTNAGFTRAQLRELSDAVMEAVRPLEERFNVKFTYRGGTYGPTAITKIEAARISESGTIETQERTDFRQKAALFGLDPEMLDKTFTYNNDEYRITGLSMRAHKMPVLATCTRNGKTYTFGVSTVKQLLGTP